jgi:Svf1-like.
MKINHLTIIIVVLVWSAPGRAGVVKQFGQQRPVTVAELMPHLRSEEMYMEVWSHGAWLKGGGDIGIDFAISNLGIGDHKGGVRVEYKDSLDRITKCNAEYSAGEWRSDSPGFHLTFGENEVLGDMHSLNLIIRCNGLSMDLRYLNQGEPFQPGSGTLTYGEPGEPDGFYSIMYSSPRAFVTGSVTANGQTTLIEGIGNAYHTWTNIGPQTQARRWFRFNVARDDFTVTLTELETPSNFGNARYGWALVYGPKGRIVATTRVRFDFDGFIKDQNSDEGYVIPRRVQLAAVDDNVSLTGKLEMTGINSVVDPLADLDFFRKAIVRRFSKPREYSIKAAYSFHLKDNQGEQTIEGASTFRYIYINP